MVDKDDFSGFAPLQPQVRLQPPTHGALSTAARVVWVALSVHEDGNGHPTPRPGLQRAKTTMNFLLLLGEDEVEAAPSQLLSSSSEGAAQTHPRLWLRWLPEWRSSGLVTRPLPPPWDD